ncbi:ATP-binding protein [Thermoflexus hugenholtzii]
MAARSAKRVWEVCEPHPDVFSRDPDPSLFAISLHHVMQGSAEKDYIDPERFFSRTYMTRALSDLLERVVGRLAGQGRGAPILRLETPFGGGKTHTMTALYHIARSPEALSDHEALRPILERLNLRALPRGVRVAVLDGRGLDVRERRTEDGLTIRTLWGELAYQLGGREGYRMLAEADETRTAPGGARLTELLQRHQPALILMDEVLEYLVKARAVKVGDSNLMEQTGAFLSELTSAVSAAPQSALVLALPASSLEVAAETQEAAERLFQYAKKVLGRMELVETPVAQDEVFGVLRKRLFRSLGSERDHRRAVEAMRDYYDQYPRFFPDRLRSPEYKERMLQAYPFHPELIDLLYERWGPHPQFQRTRGALRLLALVLRRLWNQRPGSALLIQPHHVDLSDRHIRGEVVRLLDSGWDAIVTGDILQRAGEIERELGSEYAREQLGRGAAACIFLYSISAAIRDAGATEEEVRAALLRPDINPLMASEVLKQLQERLWYLRRRDHRYFFTAKPNLNKVILDFEAGVSDEQVEKALEEHLTRLAGKGGGAFRVVVAPHEPRLVPDEPRPTLVVLPLDVSEPHEWMRRAVESAGEGIRVHRNMLVFLVPDPTQAIAVRSALRRWLALSDLIRSPSFREIEQDDRRQVENQLRDKEAEIKAFLRRAYQAVYRPGEGGTVERVSVAGPEAIRAETLDEYVRQALEKAGILVERVTPEYLKDALRVGQDRELSSSRLISVFTGSPGWPILKNPKEAITEAIAEGVQRGLWGVQVGGQTYIHQEIPKEVIRDDAVLIPPESSPAPPPPERKALTLRVRTSANLLYPLLQAAQQLKDLRDAFVLLEVHDPTGEMAKMRSELEKLLRDYGCTVEWSEGPAA